MRLIFWLRQLLHRLLWPSSHILRKLLRYPLQIWTVLRCYLGRGTSYANAQPLKSFDLDTSTSRLPVTRMSDEFLSQNSESDDVKKPEPISGSDMRLSALKAIPRDLNTPHIILIATAATRLRDKSKRPIAPKTTSSWIIEPCTTNFTSHVAPPGWTPLVQPQGALYFWHSELRVLTDMYLCDPKVLMYANAAIRHIHNEICSHDVQLPHDVHLVLDLDSEDKDNIVCGYYFVSHENRCLFWLTSTDIYFLLENMNGVTHLDHIKYRIESEYWYHWQRFPNVQQVNASILNELKGALLCGSIDLATNFLTTSQYKPDKISLYLDAVSDLQENLENGIHSTYSAYIVGRLMAMSSFQKFYNFYGQPSARLSRDQSVHEKNHRSYAIIVLSPLLFYSPDFYIQILEAILVDGYIFFEAWRRFVSELHSEWRDLTVIATVLLATNVAFLAIPTIDNGDPIPQRSAAQIVSYISIILAVSSIILGQLLTRYNRIRGWEAMDERVVKNFQYLTNIGRTRLAIMYSIPYTLLSWGMITFLGALLILCFQSTDILVRLLVGIISGLITILLLWCLWNVGGSDPRCGDISSWQTIAEGLKDIAKIVLTRSRSRQNSTSTASGVV